MLKNQIKIGKKVFTVKGEFLPMLRRYKNNKLAKVGYLINCSFCNKELVKEKESFHICSIACKDDFWNKIDPRKRNRNGKNRISDTVNYVSKEHHWSDDDLHDCEYHNKQ